MEKKASRIERIFEAGLWKLRWAVLSAVIFSGLVSILMFYVAAVDTYYVLHMIAEYAQETDMLDRKALRGEAVGHVVEVVDGFLLAIVLLIFSYGIYELYISRMTAQEEGESADHLLKIKNLDDLKSRLGKVILMILIVKFFEVSMVMEYDGVKELTIFAAAIGLISLSFFMAEMAARKKGEFKTRKSDDEQGRRSRDTSGVNQRQGDR
ncbi:MAG: YqhA family protein [Mariprofundaceae bacterium]